MNDLKNSYVRDITFDIARGIGIILVVYGHAINNNIYQEGFVFRFIYSFHMAFFFILSGYFFKEKYGDSYINVKDFIKRKAKILLVPYLFFNIIFLFLHNFFCNIHFFPTDENFFDVVDTVVPIKNPVLLYSNLDIIKHFIWICFLGYQELFVGTTWFLKVLFYISLSYVVVSFIIKKMVTNIRLEYIKILLCLICLLIGYYLSLKNWQFYKIGTIFSCMILFHVGTIFRRLNFSYNNNYILLITIFLLVIINIFNPKFFYISRNYYNNPLCFLFAGVLGYILIIGISEKLKRNKFLSKLISYIGKHTIPILCLHLLSFKFVILIQILLYNRPVRMLESYEIYYTNLLWGFVYTIVGVAVPLLLNYIYVYFKSISLKDIR